MRKFLAAAAIAGAAVTGLTVAPAAQAATTQATATDNWGRYFSSEGKAYTYGKTFGSHGKVYTKWYGVEKFGGKHGYVWFEYYKGGKWYKFSHGWDGKSSDAWSGHGIKKIYTYTCWGDSKFDNCGSKHRIY